MLLFILNNIVQHIEALARIFEERGLSKSGRVLRQVSEAARANGDAPESLEGVTVSDRGPEGRGLYQHLLFNHDRELSKVQPTSETREKKWTGLTPIEHRLLCTLEEKPDQLISSEELCEIAIGRGYLPKRVQWHIANLIRKIRPDPEKPSAIVTVRGRGYVFITDPSFEAISK